MFFVAVVFNPRYRLEYVKFWFKEWYGKDKGDAMSSKVQDASSSSTSGSGASLSRDSKPSIGNASLFDRIKSYNNRFKQHLAKDFDILMWWKMNSSRYRVLSQIAHDVLAIFVSTVAFESAFSSGGVFCIRFVVHYFLIQLKLLFVPRIG